MQVKSFISSALLLGIVAFSPAINTQEVTAKPSGPSSLKANTSKKPYCTIASKKGAFWWTWTQSSIKQSCKTARSKVKATGQKVNVQRSGYYKAKGLNKARLICNQGKKDVIGSGSAVFENGINMASKLKWNGCTLRITN